MENKTIEDLRNELDIASEKGDRKKEKELLEEMKRRKIVGFIKRYERNYC